MMIKRKRDGPSGVSLVDVGTETEDHLNEARVAEVGSPVERGVAEVISRVDRETLALQVVHQHAVVVMRRMDQCIVSLCIDCIDVCS